MSLIKFLKKNNIDSICYFIVIIGSFLCIALSESIYGKILVFNLFILVIISMLFFLFLNRDDDNQDEYLV